MSAAEAGVSQRSATSVSPAVAARFVGAAGPALSSSATVSEAESGSPTPMVTAAFSLIGLRLAVTPVSRTVTVLASSCSLSTTVGIRSTLALPVLPTLSRYSLLLAS